MRVGARANEEGDNPMEMIDLSRVIYDGMPKIPVLPDVHVTKFLSLEKGHPLNVTELSIPCHAGTHVDAPIHIMPNGKSIEELPLEAFVGPGAVIGVSKKGGEEVTAKDLESSGVAVNRGDILMLHTGWDEKFDSPDYNLHPYFRLMPRNGWSRRASKCSASIASRSICRRRCGRRDSIFRCTKYFSATKS